ncbi:helix-turn-helix transcriptional regulator [Kocuria marina]|uniref:helix-turn-helix transcriptional regulator n=1 Tax=Kocuria marina TaxID=223184 RepID=UPI0034612D87
MNHTLITPAQLAEYLSTNVQGLAQMRYLGTGPAFVKLGKRVMYRENDVQSWLEQNTHTQTGASS